MQNQSRSVASFRQVSVFSGPLPDPNDLIKYNQAFDGCAERIVAMAEGQARHRQELEKTVVESNLRHDRRGQTLGFILSLVGIMGSLGLIALGLPTEGLTVFFANLATLVGLFVYGKYQQRRELGQKAEGFSQPAQRH